MAGDDRDSAVVVKSGPPTSIQHFVITYEPQFCCGVPGEVSCSILHLHTLHTIRVVKTPAVGLLLTLRHKCLLDRPPEAQIVLRYKTLDIEQATRESRTRGGVYKWRASWQYCTRGTERYVYRVRLKAFPHSNFGVTANASSVTAS